MIEKIKGIEGGVNVSLPWEYICNERLEVNGISPKNFELHVLTIERNPRRRK